jgi:tetratricopeptide (TPR) repeat protein
MKKFDFRLLIVLVSIAIVTLVHPYIARSQTKLEKEKLAEEQPTLQIQLRLGRAKTLFQLGRYKEAIADIDKILALKPNEILAWELRGSTLYKLTRYSEALNAYDRAIELLGKQPQNSRKLATLNSKRARIVETIEDEEKVANSSQKFIQLQCISRSRLRSSDNNIICKEYSESSSLEKPDISNDYPLNVPSETHEGENDSQITRPVKQNILW